MNTTCECDSLSDQCSFISSPSHTDLWVVPHNVLPLLITIYGAIWQDTLLLVLIWEVFEVILFICYEKFEPELLGDAFISDPVQGLLGVIIGYQITRKFRKISVLNTREFEKESIFDVTRPINDVMVNSNRFWYDRFVQSVIFIALTSACGSFTLDQAIDNALHWLYPVVVLIVFVGYRYAFYRFQPRLSSDLRDIKRGTFFVAIHIVSLSVLIYSLRGHNSFWIATGWSLGYILTLFFLLETKNGFERISQI